MEGVDAEQAGEPQCAADAGVAVEECCRWQADEVRLLMIHTVEARCVVHGYSVAVRLCQPNSVHMPGDMSGLGGSAANNRIGKSEAALALPSKSQMHTSTIAAKDCL